MYDVVWVVQAQATVVIDAWIGQCPSIVGRAQLASLAIDWEA